MKSAGIADAPLVAAVVVVGGCEVSVCSVVEIALFSGAERPYLRPVAEERRACALARSSVLAGSASGPLVRGA